MSEREKTTELGEPTMKRRDFLAVGGASIAATTFGGGEGVGDTGLARD